MYHAIMNFLCTRAGAILAPIVSAAALGGVAWLGSHVPVLKPFLTSDNVAAILGLIFSLIMVMINYLTTARGFKYGLQVQSALNIIGRKFGLWVAPDGVIAHITADTADVIARSVAHENRNQSVAAATPSAAIAGNPNRKG